MQVSYNKDDKNDCPQWLNFVQEMLTISEQNVNIMLGISDQNLRAVSMLMAVKC